MSEEQDTIVITEEEAGRRLDQILAARYREVKSRTYFQTLIADQQVLLNGQAVKKRTRLQAGDEVDIFFALTPEIDLAPEPIPLEVLYEDADLLVINKPAGMVVHPAPGHWSGTFVNALLHYCKQLPGDFSGLRPGIVHRLDRDTSGVLVAAKTSLAHQRLVEMFAGREVFKNYWAVCLGNPGKGILRDPIGRHPIHRKKMAVVAEGGRSAVTHFDTLAFDGKLSLVDLTIETGRTHQIRVHLSHYRTPVLGDSVYGNELSNKKYHAGRQLLHARLIRLPHPITRRILEFEAPLPQDMQTVADRLLRSRHP